MGFFDAIGDLLDIGKEIVMLPAEIGKATLELGSDIAEAVTQDVKNKVTGEPQKEIRTSYDVRDQAEKLIQSSQSEYTRAKDKLDSAWNSMNTQSRALAEKRSTVYKLMGQVLHSICLPKLLTPNDAPIHYPVIPTLDSLQFDLGTHFGLAGINMRMDAAEEYLQRAEEFRVEVKYMVSQINCVKKSILAISQAHEEEEKMLDVIHRTYTKQAESTLIQSTEILREISSLLLEEVTSQTASKYQDYLGQLKILWE